MSEIHVGKPCDSPFPPPGTVLPPPVLSPWLVLLAAVVLSGVTEVPLPPPPPPPPVGGAGGGEGFDEPEASSTSPDVLKVYGMVKNSTFTRAGTVTSYRIMGVTRVSAARRKRQTRPGSVSTRSVCPGTLMVVSPGGTSITVRLDDARTQGAVSLVQVLVSTSSAALEEAFEEDDGDDDDDNGDGDDVGCLGRPCGDGDGGILSES